MAQNDAAFSGSIPQLYDDKLGKLLFAPYAVDLARRLPWMVASVLETAAGTGLLTAELVGFLGPGTQIVATDLNQPMLDHAAKKPGLEGIQWQQADAQAVPFGDASFEAVVCQFGVMFFPDRVAAYREAWRVLRPGGHFLFNVWGPLAANPVMAAVVEGLAGRYPQQKSWFLERTPCGYHDPDRIESNLRAAGFSDLRIETVKLPGLLRNPLDAATGLCQGSPMRAEIEALEPAGLDAATRDAAAAVARRCGEGPRTTPLLALVIEAHKEG
ncbi:MAG: methyltransferase domain-containing protein [Alphaproteobacteria bacterium]|nr:methyltransferase domain-containing protein [Alphaproteobacteria bacterium]MBV8413395.1 methyltransferase domain-containing protein [Alphaproteobacteria bacterium]